jgi:hypothetical protein
MCFVALSLAMYSLFMTLLEEESPWYGLLLYFLISILLAASILPGAVVLVHLGYEGIVNYFLEAWKDFTVEIEPGGVPIEAAFESV